MDEEEIRGPEEMPDPVQRGVEDPGAGIPWGGILLGIWAVSLIVFSVQNAEHVTIYFLAWEWNIPVALLVMVTALATLVLTGLGGAIYRRRRRARRIQAKGPQSEG
jgi:uncharacterized integral membrane protein